MSPVAHIRLISHQLSETHCKTPEDVAAWMGAMQAQDYHMAKQAIAVRLPDSAGSLQPWLNYIFKVINRLHYRILLGGQGYRLPKPVKD